jgi:branched-chain amino acid transport system substrate-binding protein
MTAVNVPRRRVLGTSLALGASVIAGPVFAQGKATGKPIKLGQTMPYSGPASAYGTIGKV